MRAPWMRKVHLFPMRRMNEERAAKFLQKYKDQNKLARRIGLPMLRAVYTVLVAAAFLQVIYNTVTYMNDRGWLSPPQLAEDRLN
jgi:hypothetical protein